MDNDICPRCGDRHIPPSVVLSPWYVNWVNRILSEIKQDRERRQRQEAYVH